MGALFNTQVDPRANAAWMKGNQADFSGSRSPYADQLLAMHQQNIQTRMDGGTPMSRGTGGNPSRPVDQGTGAAPAPSANQPRRAAAPMSFSFDGGSVYTQPNAPGKRSLLGGA